MGGSAVQAVRSANEILRRAEGAMVKLALYVKMKAKEGKGAEVEAFLRAGQAMAEDEPGTKAWFALRLEPGTYAIFDVFETEDAREAHLSGPIAAALMEKAPDLLAGSPEIHKVDVLAAKLPA